MKKTKRTEIGMGRARGFGVEQGWMKTEPPPKPRFGARLDWDPVLDPIAGRDREKVMRELRRQRGE